MLTQQRLLSNQLEKLSEQLEFKQLREKLFGLSTFDFMFYIDGIELSGKDWCRIEYHV